MSPWPALSSASRASSTPSSSTSESPVLPPCARKKLKHMAPPMSTESATSRKRSISATLSDTLAPPSTTTSGRSGDSTIRRSVTTSRSSSSPAAAGRCWATPAVLACARCAAPNASFTYTSASPASSRASSASLSVSPGSQRVFSSTSTEPSSSSAALAFASGPITSAACCTGASINSASRADAGAQRGRGVRPLGAAEMGAQDQPDALIQQQLERGNGRADASVVGHPPVLQRHVEVHAHQHALPALERQVAHGALAELRDPGLHVRRESASYATGWPSPTSTRSARSTTRLE